MNVFYAGRVVSAGRAGVARVSYPTPLLRLTNEHGTVFYVDATKVKAATQRQAAKFITKESTLIKKS